MLVAAVVVVVGAHQALMHPPAHNALLLLLLLLLLQHLPPLGACPPHALLPCLVGLQLLLLLAPAHPALRQPPLCHQQMPLPQQHWQLVSRPSLLLLSLLLLLPKEAAGNQTWPGLLPALLTPLPQVLHPRPRHHLPQSDHSPLLKKHALPALLLLLLRQKGPPVLQRNHPAQLPLLHQQLHQQQQHPWTPLSLQPPVPCTAPSLPGISPTPCGCPCWQSCS
jgi:hypothetical protein